MCACARLNSYYFDCHLVLKVVLVDDSEVELDNVFQSEVRCYLQAVAQMLLSLCVVLDLSSRRREVDGQAVPSS